MKRLLITLCLSPSLAAGQTEWREAGKLFAADGSSSAFFGLTASLDLPYAVIGSLNPDPVYLFERECNSWVELAALIGSDLQPDDLYGSALDVCGTTIIVGAPGHNGQATDCGASYIFEKVGELWVETAKLEASDPELYKQFGGAVGICGDTIIVGASGDNDRGPESGSVYVFQSFADSWFELAKITAFDGDESDRFGWSVAMDNDVFVVGAHQDEGSSVNEGSVYVYEKIGGFWTFVQKLAASDGAGSDLFGHAVSISSNTLVIGAPNDDDNGANSGSAYVFEHDGEVWKETTKLLAPDGDSFDAFGFSVDVSSEAIVIGGPQNDVGGSDIGAAYLYGYDEGEWAFEIKLLSSSVVAGDLFGSAVGIDGPVAVVTGSNIDGAHMNSGAAIAFLRGPHPECLANWDGDEDVDTRDLLKYLNDYNAVRTCGEPTFGNPDLAAPFGEINTVDLIAFLNAWSAGCK